MNVGYRAAHAAGPGRKADRLILERFTCCADDGPPCEREVQSYIRASALTRAAQREARDHRLLIVTDTQAPDEAASTSAGTASDAVVGVGAHERGEVTVDGLRTEVRVLVFGAIRFDLRGRFLSDGTPAVRALFDAQVTDIADRGSPEFLVSYIDPDNHRSLAVAVRHGFTQIGSEGRLLVFATPLLASGTTGSD